MQQNVVNHNVAGSTTEQAQAPDSLGPRLIDRRHFLIDNGFRRDTFAYQTAEQEYAHADRIELDEPPLDADTTHVSVNGSVYHMPAPPLLPDSASPTPLPDPSRRRLAEPKPLFSPLAFFVDPVYARRQDGFTLEDLRRRQHSFIFGRPGAGKTTTRFALEAHIRIEPRRTLNVTMEYAGRAATSAAGLSRHLVRAIATDLFVQVVEQFAHRQALPTARQDQAMLWLLARGGRELQRVFKRLLSERELSPTWGLAPLWRLLARPIVRPARRTELLTTWLASLDKRLAETQTAAMPAGRWQSAVRAARVWNVETIFVAIDGVDTEQRTRRDMMSLLRPMLDKAPAFAAQGVYLKCFLPLELRDDVRQRLRRAGVADADAPFTNLEWDRARLNAVLMERYIAGGAARRTLADLVSSQLDDIDERVLSAADGSPRRLVTLIDQLIAVHTARLPVQRSITTAEWQEALRRTADILRGQS